MSEAKSSKAKVCFQIQEFLLQKSASFTQIVEVCDADKATVEKYLTELISEGIVVLKPKRKQGIEKYMLSDAGKDKITVLLEKQKIKTQIDQMSPENFQEFKKFLEFVAKSKNGEEFTLHVIDAKHSGKNRKFKNVGTNVLPKT